jgi:hypothetical protein
VRTVVRPRFTVIATSETGVPFCRRAVPPSVK